MKIRMTERRWLLLITAVCALAAGTTSLIVRLKGQPGKTESAIAPLVYWRPPPTPQQAQSMEYVIADLLDPSLLSLPSLQGFSRDLWEHQLTATRRPFEPGPQFAFMNIQPPSHTQSLLEQAQLADLVQSSAKKESAAPEDGGADETTPQPAATDHSVMQLVEAIANRQIIQSPDPPTIQSAAPIRPTRVRIAVGADGVVRYAILDRSAGSGLASSEADTQALRSAQRIRFDPQLGGEGPALTWGLLRFVWATMAPSAATNEAKVTGP
jgi:hypothetical protein